MLYLIEKTKNILLNENENTKSKAICKKTF